MAGVEFDVSEINALAADLDRAPARVTARSTEEVMQATRAMERDAKVFVPVDTGTLQGSIESEITGSGDDIEGLVGPTEDYGLFVEVGTSVMPPQPFMGPALERNMPGFVAGMADAAGDIL